MEFLEFLQSGFTNITWQMIVMWAIGAILIYLAIGKKYEPALLLPMGFGAILVNLPLSGAITQGMEIGILNRMFDFGIATEAFPLMRFIGITAFVQSEDAAVRRGRPVRNFLHDPGCKTLGI